jgi:hypothetical protein
MNIEGKRNDDGSVEFTVQLTKEEADTLKSGVEPTGIFDSKAEYCVTCTGPNGPVSPSQTIEAYGDIHANAIAFKMCGTGYSLRSGRCP